MKILVADMLNYESIYLIGTIEENKKVKIDNIIYSNKDLNEEILNVKKIFAENNCSYIVLNLVGIGQRIYDLLTDTIYDKENNIFYGWTVCRDICSEEIISKNQINDLIKRTISKNASEVIIPFIPNAIRNSDMYLLTRKTIKENLFDKNDETDLLLKKFDSLDIEIRNGLIKVVEKNNYIRDRYIVFGMFCYIYNLLFKNY